MTAHGEDSSSTSADDDIDRNVTRLLARATKLVKELGLYEHSLQTIMNDKNDWSFIIKIHSLVEIALNHLLSQKLTVLPIYLGDSVRPALSNFIARLPIGGRNGKTKLATDLKLIAPTASNVITRLTEIRNFYAHDPRHMEIAIKQYIFDIKKSEQSRFHTVFFPWHKEDPKSVFEYADAYRLLIFLSVGTTLSLIGHSLEPRPTLLTDTASHSDGAGERSVQGAHRGPTR